MPEIQELAQKNDTSDVKTEGFKNDKVKTATIGKAFVVGRRKEAIARVRLFPGSGVWTINGRKLENYFPNKVHQQLINSPLVLTGQEKKYDITVNVRGGGTSGQAGAIRLGVSRALNEIDAEILRPSLKKAGFLTRDDRKVERKKAGLKKARKASQFSKR
ncbi:MAG: 30S ribosomal protein S9 [Candidatus Ancillula sp.]|jgi:small subunit ribosomal protein S9|nr:30S ribosomal protein S9 [Candidatus Ancillula sp.]